jgi:hypothetical protein
VAVEVHAAVACVLAHEAQVLLAATPARQHSTSAFQFSTLAALYLGSTTASVQYTGNVTRKQHNSNSNMHKHRSAALQRTGTWRAAAAAAAAHQPTIAMAHHKTAEHIKPLAVGESDRRVNHNKQQQQHLTIPLPPWPSSA